MTKALDKKRAEILALPSVVAIKANAAKYANKKRLPVADVKELVKDKGLVERVYITRGDSELNENSVLCDKYSGLLINGDIYWIEDKFATIEELATILHPLGIGVKVRGSYGTWGWDDDREEKFDAKLTKVGEDQSTMLEEGSRWLDKAVWADKKNDRLTWTVKELQKVLLDTEKKALKAAEKKNQPS